MNSNISDFKGLPKWATSLGIREPKGLQLNQSDSSIIKDNGVMPDSFNITYTGDSNVMMKEAQAMAKELNVKVVVDEISIPSFVAGGELDNGKYNVSIIVGPSGFMIAASNIEQREKYNTIKK